MSKFKEILRKLTEATKKDTPRTTDEIYPIWKKIKSKLDSLKSDEAYEKYLSSLSDEMAEAFDTCSSWSADKLHYQQKLNKKCEILLNYFDKK